MFSYRFLILGHQQQIALQACALGLLYITLPILGQPFGVPTELQLSMTIAADYPLENFVQAFGNRMVCFEAEDICLCAIETARHVPHLLAAHLCALSSRAG